MSRVPDGHRAVIAGIGHTEFSQHSGRSPLQLASEASLAAINDAGLSPADIDGNVTFAMDSTDELALIRSLGIPELRFSARTRGAPSFFASWLASTSSRRRRSHSSESRRWSSASRKENSSTRATADVSKGNNCSWRTRAASTAVASVRAAASSAVDGEKSARTPKSSRKSGSCS